MENRNQMETYRFEDTRFIFATNFSGDPKRDNFGDTRRKVNLIIPSEAQAKELTKKGFKVRQTKPGKYDTPEEFVPEYYIMVQVKYRKNSGEPVKYPPNVKLVIPGKDPVAMSEETVGSLDHIRVKNVNCVSSARDYVDRDGKPGKNLFARTMYVEQDMDYDPFAERYRRTDELAPAYEGEDDDTI